MEAARTEAFPSPLREAAARCSACGLCRQHCTALDRHGTPAEFLLGPGAEDAAYDCALCGLCTEVCPAGVDLVAAFRHLRHRAFSSGRHPARRWLGRRLFEALGRSGPMRAWSVPPGADTVFFPGCALPGVRPGAVLRLWSDLRRAAPQGRVGLALDCCAALSRNLGDEEGFLAAARGLAVRLRESGVRRVLTACPSCLAALRAAKLPVELASAYETLADAAAPAPNPVRRLALHDPCATRGERSLHDAVRRLAAAAGIGVLELPNARERTQCCGAGERAGLTGGGAAPATPDAADGLFTYCAGCAGILERRRPTAHLVDLLYPDHAPPRPQGWVRQFWNRWRLARRVRKRGEGALDD